MEIRFPICQIHTPSVVVSLNDHEAVELMKQLLKHYPLDAIAGVADAED
jgi:hypothetical protein